MAREIVVVQREPRLTRHGGGFNLTALFLYPFDPPMDTKTPPAQGGPKRIAPSQIDSISEEWAALLSATELQEIADGELVFVPFSEPISQEQADDLPGEGVAFLRSEYIVRDPRTRHRYSYQFTGLRLDAV